MKFLILTLTAFLCLLPFRHEHVHSRKPLIELHSPIEKLEPQIKLASIEIPVAEKVAVLELKPMPVAKIGGFSGGDYAYGWCTYLVATQVYVPRGLGNANTWDNRAPALGGTVSGTPVIGAVAQTDAGGLGHVAVVLAVNAGKVLVREMAYKGWNIVDERWASVGDFNYLYF